jgi:hypothetical protein
MSELLMKCNKIEEAIKEFAYWMSIRMFGKVIEGVTGWDGEGDTPVKDYELIVRIKEKLQKEHMTRQDCIDIANFALMLWWMKK